MKVKDIYSYLNELFPCESAVAYDNPGILVGNSDDEVKKALVALDCNIDIIEIAKKENCNLIITHHPVIFDGLKSVTENTVVYNLIKNNISVISMHTNMDMGKNGVNDALCNVLELENITEIDDGEGFILRKGSLSPISPEKLAKHISDKLGSPVKYIDSGKDIKNILVCSGSGGSYINLAKKLCCDALITADVKHNIFMEACNSGISVFDAGHFETEDVIVEPLTHMLNKKFPDLQFIPCHFSRIKYV